MHVSAPPLGITFWVSFLGTMIGSLLAGALIAVSVAVLARYDLSRERHATIQAALLDRRQEVTMRHVHERSA